MREPRLGDDIDDFCIRCKRLTNHLVVSVVNSEPAKVRCRSCHNDHDFRHEQAPPPKLDPRKAALFNEVLKKVSPEAAAEELPEEPIELEEIPIAEEAGDAVPEVNAVEEVEPEEVEEVEAVKAPSQPKVKNKVKTKGKAKKQRG